MANAPWIAKPSDLLRVGADFYEVTGIHSGGLGQESVTTLRTLTQTAPAAYGERLSEMVVPDSLIRAALHAGAAEHYQRNARP